MAALEVGAVVLHLVLVPAVADAEQEAPPGDLVDRGHRLGGLNGIALVDQADAGADLQLLRDRGRRRQRHEGVHGVVVLLGQLTPARPFRLARQRNVRVLGRPHRFEAAFLQGRRELRRRHGVVGEEHRRADMHGFPSYAAAFAFLGHRASTSGSTFSISFLVWAMIASPSGPTGRRMNFSIPTATYSATRSRITFSSPMAK